MLEDGDLLIGKNKDFCDSLSKVINKYGIDSELGMRDLFIADYVFEQLRTLKHFTDAKENYGG